MRVADVEFVRTEAFDLEVFVCGYESRCSYTAKISQGGDSRRIVLDYDSSDSGSYNENRRWFESAGCHLMSENLVLEEVAGASAQGLRIRIDVSSMRRLTLAKLIEALGREGLAIKVQFVYAPAAYESSSKAAIPIESLSAGPLTPFFSGTVRTTRFPVGLVAGLGLEEHRIVGITELLEPAHLWAFIAHSDDPRFHEAVAVVNGPVISDAQTTQVRYDMRSVADTYAAVESLVFAASQSYRVVLAPSGPKIFSLACLLVAYPRSNLRPAVWRVGSQDAGPAIDVAAKGDVVAVDVWI